MVGSGAGQDDEGEFTHFYCQVDKMLSNTIRGPMACRKPLVAGFCVFKRIV
jgi:hypothetical protein